MEDGGQKSVGFSGWFGLARGIIRLCLIALFEQVVSSIRIFRCGQLSGLLLHSFFLCQSSGLLLSNWRPFKLKFESWEIWVAFIM